MTVKCVTKAQKDMIRVAYTSTNPRIKKNIKQIAAMLSVSERTISRVLAELGLASPTQLIKGEAYQVMQMLKKHKVDMDELTQILQARKRVIIRSLAARSA